MSGVDDRPADVLPIAGIRIGQRHRKDLGDIESLARSIADIGLLHPVVVRPDGLLVAGERRLRAAQLLGWADIPVTVVDLNAVVRGELAENAERKDFLPSEIDAIRRALEPIEKAAAKERMLVGKPSGNFPQGAGGKTRDRIAAFAGVSGRTIEKIAKVVEAAEAEPERYGKLLADMDRTGRANGVYKRLRVSQQAAQIRAEPPPLPGGPYRVIVADPPWPYEKRTEDPSNRATYDYPTMSIAAICALPVRSLAEADSILWLWTTNHHMREAFDVVEASIFLGATPGIDPIRPGSCRHSVPAARGLMPLPYNPASPYRAHRLAWSPSDPGRLLRGPHPIYFPHRVSTAPNRRLR